MNDPILGEYQACSLMSPLGPDIADQATAQAVALSAFRIMLSDMPEPPEERGTSLKKRVVPIRPAPRVTRYPKKTSRYDAATFSQGIGNDRERNRNSSDAQT